MSTELTKKEDNALALSDLQKEFAGAITVRREILKVARIKLANGTSESVKSRMAQIGDFTCDLKGKNYGTAITIIPMFSDESASLLDETGRRPICSSRDLIKNRDGIPCKQCPHGEYWDDWGVNNSKTPKCKTSINVLCLTQEPNGEIDSAPAVFSFRKMAIKAGKALINYVVNDDKGVPFGSKYKIKSEQKSQDNYTFMVPSDKMEKIALTEDELGRVIPVASELMKKKRAGQLVQEEEEGEAPAQPVHSRPSLRKDDDGLIF